MVLPIMLANTVYVSDGAIRDGLTTTAQLVAWLRGARSELAVELTAADLAGIVASDLEVLRSLRTSIRAAAAAISAGQPAGPADIQTINAQVRAAPTWRELGAQRQPRAQLRSRAPKLAVAYGEIAQAAVDLLASARMSPCQSPPCVQFFFNDQVRRRWCSDRCGNRARAARHYASTQLRRSVEITPGG